MRLNRILYASLLVMSFVFVYLEGGKIPYMLFYTVLILPVISSIYSVVGLLSVHYEQTIENKRVIKGETVKLKLRIINRGFMMLPYVRISVLGEATASAHLQYKDLSLAPFSQIELCIEQQYNYRGTYPLGVNRIEIRDFLGIFKFVRRNRQLLNITVYPRILEMAAMVLNHHRLWEVSSRANNIYEDATIIDEVQPYGYGDSLRKIHWKLTAKLNEVMVKKYQKTTEETLSVVLDLRQNLFTKEENRVIEDKYIEVVVAILKSLVDQSIAVELIYEEEARRHIVPCNHVLDFNDVYESLAHLRFKQTLEVKTLLYSLQEAKNKEILLFTAKLDEALHKLLKELKLMAYEIHLIYIVGDEIGEEEGGHRVSKLAEAGIEVDCVKINQPINEVLWGSLNQ